MLMDEAATEVCKYFDKNVKKVLQLWVGNKNIFG
jgi:hypothetical protein